MNSYFVTGIGTGIGKTVISAILVRKLQAAYWKPIQAGSIDNTDSIIVRDLASYNFTPRIVPESYVLKNAMSPHAAAALENIKIDLDRITIPKLDYPVIIEGAGGLLVPLSDEYLVIDLIKKFNIPTIIVSKFYLGSINHTLLTVESLKAKNIPIAGIIFCGDYNPTSEEAILRHTKVTRLGYIPEIRPLNSEAIFHAGHTIEIL